MDETYNRECKVNNMIAAFKRHFPKLEGDKVTFIGSTFLTYGSVMPYLSHCIVLNDCAPSTGIEIETCKNYEYKLIGFIEHHGETKNGGHYTADCLNILKNEWLHYDDKYCKMIDKNYITKNNAYLLLYSLI